MRLMLLFGAFTAAAAAICTPVARAQAFSSNLLPPLNQWTFSPSGGTSGSVSTDGNGAVVTIDRADSLRNACIQTQHIHFQLDRDYHIRCLLSADAKCQVEIALVPSTGIIGHGPFDQTVQIGPAWTPFETTFTADGIGMNDATLMIFVGGCSGTYRIASASIVPAGAGDANNGASAAALPQTVVANSHPVDASWTLELGGRAQAGPIYSANGLILEIDKVDGNAGDIQYAREGADLRPGVTYTLHFQARAGSPRPIHLEAQDQAGTPAGLARDIVVGANWQEYNLTFTATNSSGNKGRITLMLGAKPGAVQIADLAYAPAAQSSVTIRTTTAPAIPGDLRPVATWDLDTVGQTMAMVTPSTGGAVVQIDRTDGLPGHVVLKQDGISLDDGATYQLAFKAKATVARRIPILAQVENGPKLVGLNDSVRVTPQWQDFRITFTAMKPIPAHSRIAFLLGGSSGTVELSDVALQPTDPPVTKVSASLQGQ